MNNLGLPHPKQIDVAVPANLKCGEPPPGSAAGEDSDWAPLTLTFAGIWEVQPQWLEEHLREVQIVDVREPAEFDGPLGHIAGARLLPLGSLTARAGELAPDLPIVTVCRSGARSAQASVLLRKAGHATRSRTSPAECCAGMRRVFRRRRYRLGILGAAGKADRLERGLIVAEARGQRDREARERARALLGGKTVDQHGERIVEPVLLELPVSAGMGWRGRHALGHAVAEQLLDGVARKHRLHAAAARQHMAIRTKHVSRRIFHAIAIEQAAARFAATDTQHLDRHTGDID